MTTELWTAILALVGTIVGSLGGILASSRLTTYRIKKLEEKVDKHNHLIERMAVVEQSCKAAHHRIDDMEHREGQIKC